MGFDNEISTLIMRSYDPLIQPAVTLFKDPYCREISAYMLGPENPGETEYIYVDELKSRYFEDNRMSSLMIPKGIIVTLYDDPSLTETASTLTIMGGDWRDEET